MSDHTPIQLPLAIEGATIEIPLTRGYVAIVDAVDADLVGVGWRASTPMKAHYQPYAQKSVSAKRNNGKKGIVLLHRVILARIVGRELEPREECDHRDGNPLNNRRSNLRLASHQENMKNRRLNVDNKSGYKGVCYEKRRRRWEVRITVNGKRIRLGLFKTVEQAAEAYAKAAEQYHGEFTRTTE